MFFIILDDDLLLKRKYVNNLGIIRSSTKSLVIDIVNQQHDNHETSSDFCIAWVIVCAYKYNI